MDGVILDEIDEIIKGHKVIGSYQFNFCGTYFHIVT
jgi:hypothetical protein